MDTVEPLRILLSFGLVISLIGMCALGLRWFAKRNPKWLAPSAGRIQIMETRMLDARRKLILIKRDEQEHLILISPQGELLIESVKDKNSA
jgi:flagellar protein FliO/FliZ